MQVMHTLQELALEFQGANYLVKVAGLARVSDEGDTVRFSPQTPIPALPCRGGRAGARQPPEAGGTVRVFPQPCPCLRSSCGVNARGT